MLVMAQLETLVETGPCADAATSPACASGCYVVAALVFLMVSIGGATRLTGSGLSITEWQPIMGAVPPLSRSRLAARPSPSTARSRSTSTSTAA